MWFKNLPEKNAFELGRNLIKIFFRDIHVFAAKISRSTTNLETGSAFEYELSLFTKTQEKPGTQEKHFNKKHSLFSKHVTALTLSCASRQIFLCFKRVLHNFFEI